jgi:hypothetical protein
MIWPFPLPQREFSPAWAHNSSISDAFLLSAHVNLTGVSIYRSETLDYGPAVEDLLWRASHLINSTKHTHGPSLV